MKHFTPVTDGAGSNLQEDLSVAKLIKHPSILIFESP